MEPLFYVTNPSLVFLLYILTPPLSPHEPFLKAAGRDKERGGDTKPATSSS